MSEAIAMNRSYHFYGNLLGFVERERHALIKIGGFFVIFFGRILTALEVVALYELTFSVECQFRKLRST